VIVFISGRGSKRRIETIARLTGLNGETYELSPLTAPNSKSKNPRKGD